MVEKVRKWTD